MVRNLINCFPELKGYEEDIFLLSFYLSYKVQTTKLPDGFRKRIGSIEISVISNEGSIQLLDGKNHGFKEYKQIVVLNLYPKNNRKETRVFFLKTILLVDGKKKIILEEPSGKEIWQFGELDGKEVLIKRLIKIMGDRRESTVIDVENEISLD